MTGCQQYIIGGGEGRCEGFDLFLPCLVGGKLRGDGGEHVGAICSCAGLAVAKVGMLEI